MDADEVQKLLQKLDPKGVKEVGILKRWMGLRQIAGSKTRWPY